MIWILIVPYVVGMAQYVDELFFMMNEECVKMLENIKLCDVEERLGQIKELRL